jgi:glutamate synthase (ferredoxin)
MKHGLYDSSFEHDACGVGLICRMSGHPSHDIVEAGLRILTNLDHRGARGSDPNTGDGAGILVQLPHAFLKEACRSEGLRLPDTGDFGVGMMFMPRSDTKRKECEAVVERILAESGFPCIGWRAVETVNRSLGASARATEPSMWQLFVGRPDDVESGIEFERRLFVVRRKMDRSRLVLRGVVVKPDDRLQGYAHD